VKGTSCEGGYQQGSLIKVDGSWIAQWWEDGIARSEPSQGINGRKSEAQAEPRCGFLAPSTVVPKLLPLPQPGVEFVNHTYLPFYRRKWKLSTRMTNEDRFRVHLTSLYEDRALGTFSGRVAGHARLQGTRQACRTASWRICAGLASCFAHAVQEGHLLRNPAELLFIPREAKRSVHTL